MDSQLPAVLYETLPLSALSAPSSPLSDQPSDPYTVLRNEISLHDGESVALDSTAPDFFSLDVDDPFQLDTELAPSPDHITPLPSTPATEPTEEVTLESGWFRGNSRFKSPMLQLHKEIVDFCEFLSPTPEEEASRNTAVSAVFDVIKYIWPHCKPEVFGSFSTGLYLPTSDIDVVILQSHVQSPQTGLHALSRALSQRGIVKKMQVIAKARVPIVKFVEKRSGIAFDVSFDLENGPKAADFIREVVRTWPPIRPLCLILKVFLQQRELNEVYSGGIGSYALLSMLMAMLQTLQDGRAYPEYNLGVLLVRFFDFYGRKLNTKNVGVSCNGRGTFFLKSSKGFTNKARGLLISIEDPQAPENDIGKNSFNYSQIKSAFAMACTTLTNPKNILSLGPNRSILGTIIRPDPVLLERKGGSNGRLSFTSVVPGAGEPLQLHSSLHQSEILCNWQLDDEPPFPREKETTADPSARSSGRKRKSSSKKKAEKTGELLKGKNLENGSAKGTSVGKKKKKKKKKILKPTFHEAKHLDYLY